ncbi:uncharacterized protein LOC117322236 [Pecten maximus]|uniref:uncharacterized protein LOC117322236 n=1 Tax=Pecten maximus TaxID=6579 RepID=UPI0014580225|nr:uncharacterized protein LOC117322236 [Pecten maximus]XP_033732937.1 uncharacterized protein LOC117322236 [Pecten maximus]
MNLNGLKKPSGRVIQSYLKRCWHIKLLRTPSTTLHTCCKSAVQASDTLLTHPLKKPCVLTMSPFCGCPNNLRGQKYGTTSKGVKPDSISDEEVDPILQTATISDTKLSTFTEIVPGKGPPPEPPVNCCMSGCANCVWIKYAEELKEYYCDGKERALRDIELIDNPSLKAFIKLELSLL